MAYNTSQEKEGKQLGTWHSIKTSMLHYQLMLQDVKPLIGVSHIENEKPVGLEAISPFHTIPQ